MTCADFSFGYTTDRVERMRAGLPPEPHLPVRPITNREAINDLALRFARGGAAVVAAFTPLAVALERWLDSPVNPPDQR